MCAAGSITHQQSPALATQEPLSEGNVVSTSQQSNKSSHQPAAAAAVSDNLSGLGRADHHQLAHAPKDPFDNLPSLLTDEQPLHEQTHELSITSSIQLLHNTSLLDTALLDTHSSLPASGENTLSVDDSHALHTSSPYTEQSGVEQAAEGMAAGAAEVQPLGFYVQPATDSLPNPADKVDMPESSTAVANSQASTSASLQDSLDALSADEDDFADNVELSSAGMLSEHLPRQQTGRTPDDVSSLLMPDPQSLQEPAHASQQVQNQQQQVLQQQADAQIASQPAADDTASTQVIESAAQQDSTAKDYDHTTDDQASLAASVSEQATHRQLGSNTAAAAMSHEDAHAVEQQHQPIDKVTELEQKQDELQHDAVDVLPPHEAAMAKAEEAERRLLTGGLQAVGRRHACAMHAVPAAFSICMPADKGQAHPHICNASHGMVKTTRCQYLFVSSSMYANYSSSSTHVTEPVLHRKPVQNVIVYLSQESMLAWVTIQVQSQKKKSS